MDDVNKSPAVIVSRELIAPDDEPCEYCAERAKPGEYYHCSECDAEWHPEEDERLARQAPARGGEA